MWLGLLVLAVFVMGCGPSAKKKAELEAKAEEEYDYRQALQLYKIGINHLNNEENIRALDNLKQAVELDSANWRYRHGLGLAYSLNGQLEEAVGEFEKALEINPNSSETRNVLGTVYTDLGRFSEASDQLSKVIADKNYPQPQFAYFNLGLSLRKQGRVEEALAAFTRATQLDEEFYRAYLAVAEIYKERRDHRNALYYFQRAEPGYAEKVEVIYEIGRALFLLKDFDRAKSYLAQVSILFPPPDIDKNTQDMLRYIEKYQRESGE
jgi:superkiller protein 3